MKHLLSVLTFLGAATVTVAQPRFAVPLTVTDGYNSKILFFGIAPSVNYCIFGTDSIESHSEVFLPPVPPVGIFDTRFVWPRTGWNLPCFDQGSWCDFRPYFAPAQRDTFKVQSQKGQGTTLRLSWPAGLSSRFTQLTLRYFDDSIGANVNINMLTSTTANITNAVAPQSASIFSGGLVVAVEQKSAEVPTRFALGQNYPNPFNPSTTIGFDIQRAATTEIVVYDVLGQHVATLASQFLAPGSYAVLWNGKNSAGSDVGSGVYFVYMSAKSPVAGEADNGIDFSAIQKLLLIR